MTASALARAEAAAWPNALGQIWTRLMQDQRWKLFWFSLGLAAFGVMTLAFYPSLATSTADFRGMVGSVPRELLTIFGATPEEMFDPAGRFSLGGFLGARFLNLFWIVIVAAYAIATASGLVAGEVEHGTLALTLATPVARSQILAGRVLALVAGLLILAAATYGSLALSALVFDVALGAPGVLAAAVVAFAFSWAIGGYSLLVSAASSSRGRATGLATGVTAIFYAVDVAAKLKEEWEALRYLTIWSAYHPAIVIESGELPINEVLVLLLVGATTLGAAFVMFQRRDLVM